MRCLGCQDNNETQLYYDPNPCCPEAELLIPCMFMGNSRLLIHSTCLGLPCMYVELDSAAIEEAVGWSQPAYGHHST